MHYNIIMIFYIIDTWSPWAKALPVALENISPYTENRIHSVYRTLTSSYTILEVDQT